MSFSIRKFAKFVDKTFIEGGKKAKEPVLLVTVAAVIMAGIFKYDSFAGGGPIQTLSSASLTCIASESAVE